MKRQTKSILVLWLILALLALSATAQAAGQPQLRLSARPARLKVGRETTVDVRVKNAPTIYGADVRVVFDPGMLEVVDADKKLGGIQIEPGKFLDPAKSFFLQHQVSNEAGTIDYALTLLNPAPPAQGDGRLARIRFRARAGGHTTITIQEGLFGTQIGETIVPVVTNVELEIVAPSASQSSPGASLPVGEPATSDDGNSESDDLSFPGGLTDPRYILAVALAGLVGVGLVGGWFWFSRK